MASFDSPTTLSQPVRQYESVGRQAWIILWIAFAVFVMLAVGIPLGINWYIHNATLPHAVQVDAIRGTTLILEPDSEEITAVIDEMSLREGDIVRTDETARANLSVFGSEEASENLSIVQLRSNSELILVHARTPRFQSSIEPHTIQYTLNLGRARITGNPGSDRALQIVVETPHARVFLDEGSAVLAVSNEGTEVSARSGSIRVEAQNRVVQLEEGRRTIVSLGQPPSYPQETSQNLVQNGDFNQPLANTWEVERLVDAGDLSNVTYGEVSIIENSGRNATYFVREGEEGIHTETAIIQEINADVLDYDSLILRMDARLISQSLPGGGFQSSEFPLMVRIDFIDLEGNPRFWTHGFYAVDPVGNWPIRDGEKIPSFVWYEYESPDFLNSPTFPRPQKVTSIRVYASGHNYRSQASDIGLIAQ